MELSKTTLTGIKTYGSLEAWKAEMRRRGSKGGKAKVPKGFAPGSQRAREAGRKGGITSKRLPTRFIMVDGQRVAVVDYARQTGQHYQTVLQRAKKRGELV